MTSGSTTTSTPTAMSFDRAKLVDNPYIKQFLGRPMVVKAGGRSLADQTVNDHFTEDVFLLRDAGIKPIVVHGGGPQITFWLKRLGIETAFKDGHRVTTPESLEITRMVLVGKLNRELVAGINRFGPVALGLSGEDLGLLTASQLHPELGLVGEVIDVNTELIDLLIDDRLVPVIATIATDPHGQAYNINADLGASAVAAAIGAEKLIYLTDVDGIMANVSDPGSLVSQVSTGELQRMIDVGALMGGMRPKAEASLQAVASGVRSAHILNGGIPHALLAELLTDDGVGTMITERGQS